MIISVLFFSEIILKQVSDYHRIIVLESGDDEMERVIKERAETSEREDDKEEISRTKVQVYNENTRPMIDSLADPSKAVKVYYCTLYSLSAFSLAKNLQLILEISAPI